MNDPSPLMPVPSLLEGAAADWRLDQIVGASSSRRNVFVPTLNAARNGYGVPGPMAPPAARGLRAWIDGTEELRLRLHRHGWEVPKKAALNGAGLVISPDGETAIAMVSGDGATGLPGLSPQVRYARGPVASEVIQGTLFAEFDEVPDPMRTWYMLHMISVGGWRAELALPRAVDNNGWVTSWVERVQIVEDRPDGGSQPAMEDGPELPAPTVRWRESA